VVVAIVVGTVVVAGGNEFVALGSVAAGAVDDAEKVVVVQEVTITKATACRIAALTNAAAF
jgi:hypothetical protein